ARDGLEGLGLAAEEEDGVALAKAKLGADRLGLFRTKRLGDRAGGLGRAVLGPAPEDVAHARQAFLLGKGVHPVGELAAAAGGRRNGADLVALGFKEIRKDRETRAAEVFGNVLHPDRIAQVPLVGAVPR